MRGIGGDERDISSKPMKGDGRRSVLCWSLDTERRSVADAFPATVGYVIEIYQLMAAHAVQSNTAMILVAETEYLREVEGWMSSVELASKGSVCSNS